ncbi:hypothetical protein ASPACDRAFT_45090 [Aspergillus aculeatus ATCC 16872]|uniref:Uncharacterized protein n=1 Tax=Aspergillus aculeatus (strain ATCC 16872 / CBS 172.66 / WB 5094) TaxID=690307 RepID=A0A1L9WNS7_ASPA1|nr:uncharacterized protein ASPACDRAFT_45090 [Aspergillus aculeatus ATCC 16872]OJJ97791.1 hypothetical protein ASPACDRAFT_45090 [Aspergillus aculeatus ATCC 16872]
MKSALDYVFKGAEMALNRAVLLEQEVRELRWANERLNTKKRRRNKQLTGLNGFTVNEAREAFQRDLAAGHLPDAASAVFKDIYVRGVQIEELCKKTFKMV